MQINERKGRNAGGNKFKNEYDYEETGTSNETISVVSNNNCLSCTQQFEKERNERASSRDKSTDYTSGTENKSIECLQNKTCYDRRLRKRISRGVQTELDKKLSHRGSNWKIVSLFKFKCCSSVRKQKNQKEKKNVEQKGSHIAENGSETHDSQRKSVQVIYNKPRRNRGRTNNDNNNNFLDKNISDNESITSGNKSDRSTKEKPVQTTNADDYPLKKKYKRKYDISFDGKSVGITRTEKSSELSKKLGNSSETDSRVEKAGPKKIGRGRTRNKQNAGATPVPDKKSLSVSSDERSSDHFDERKSNKPAKRHEAAVTTALKRKDEAVNNKTAKVERPRRTKFTKNNSKALNINEDKDTRDYTTAAVKIDKGVINPTEKPRIENETLRGSKETKNSLGFKLFSKRKKKSDPDPRLQPPLDEESSHGEIGKRSNNYRVPKSRDPIDKRLDARRNDIANVKKRLDDCIADLNDIILNLSKVFQQIHDPGGPSGEGKQPPENIKHSRRGRSRLRN